jgi:hypothetical protein
VSDAPGDDAVARRRSVREKSLVTRFGLRVRMSLMLAGSPGESTHHAFGAGDLPGDDLGKLLILIAVVLSVLAMFAVMVVAGLVFHHYFPGMPTLGAAYTSLRAP